MSGLPGVVAEVLVPGAVSVFGIFLFRQAMVAVPDELVELWNKLGGNEVDWGEANVGSPPLRATQGD